MFAGKPENNAYAMFCIYMYLGDTHLCNEPDFDNPAGIDYYQSHGSTWGSGGRIQIYSMYELGGISTGEYKIRCGHSGATDLTSLQEKQIMPNIVLNLDLEWQKLYLETIAF